jgi:hypothetical protein
MRSRALQSPLIRAFNEHVGGIYSWMDARAKRLHLFLPFTRSEFREWVLRDLFANSHASAVQCSYCSLWLHGGNFVVDHAEPVCYGGSLGFDNLVLSCAECNLLKGRMTEAGFRSFLGFLLTLPARDVGDMVGRMKNGAAYIREKAARGRRKSVATAGLMPV